MKETTIIDVRTIYHPGNVVFCNYWMKYDLVLEYKEEQGERWQVKVITCDSQGVPILGAKARWHSTYPSTQPHQPHMLRQQ